MLYHRPLGVSRILLELVGFFFSRGLGNSFHIFSFFFRVNLLSVENGATDLAVGRHVTFR